MRRDWLKCVIWIYLIYYCTYISMNTNNINSNYYNNTIQKINSSSSMTHTSEKRTPDRITKTYSRTWCKSCLCLSSSWWSCECVQWGRWCPEPQTTSRSWVRAGWWGWRKQYTADVSSRRPVCDMNNDNWITFFLFCFTLLILFYTEMHTSSIPLSLITQTH